MKKTKQTKNVSGEIQVLLELPRSEREQDLARSRPLTSKLINSETYLPNLICVHSRERYFSALIIPRQVPGS